MSAMMSPMSSSPTESRMYPSGMPFLQASLYHRAHGLSTCAKVAVESAQVPRPVQGHWRAPDATERVPPGGDRKRDRRVRPGGPRSVVAVLTVSRDT